MVTDQTSVETLLERAAEFVPSDRSILHLDLASWLRCALDGDAFPDGARVPSERQLSAAFRVSRMTIRRALEHVTGRGILQREVGSRIWRVRKRPPIEINVSEFTGFTAQLLESGFSVHTRVVEARERAASEGELGVFALRQGARVHEVRRVRDVEGEPVLLERFVMPTLVAPSLSEEDLTGSVYALLGERYHRRPARATHRIMAASLDAVEAELLGRRPGLAVLRLRRQTFDESGTVIEVSDDLMCSDRLSVTTSGPVG